MRHWGRGAGGGDTTLKGATLSRVPPPAPISRYPSSRSEDNPERSRTGSESSQSGAAGPPGTTAGTGPTGRTTRRRESEKSVEGDACGREEEGREEKQPLKVMPAPPPKENAWAKRSSSTAGRSPGSDSEQHSPSSGQLRWLTPVTNPNSETNGGPPYLTPVANPNA
ncbi:hypothetical protein CIB84_014337 [Bambusicola thoracicus]|uniref:Uncharacterized protein n=1 Tax=Bambusicola thoracicus TaxID=9083 RepID=A0A2P4SCS0_BAMTH|nr:hypothetical protein CIB84_014337 [Bambusicola thoracicus]